MCSIVMVYELSFLHRIFSYGLAKLHKNSIMFLPQHSVPLMSHGSVPLMSHGCVPLMSHGRVPLMLPQSGGPPIQL